MEDLPKNVNPGIELTNLSAKWDSNAEEDTLKNISMSVESGKLCAIMGAVGSGKVTDMST